MLFEDISVFATALLIGDIVADRLQLLLYCLFGPLWLGFLASGSCDRASGPASSSMGLPQVFNVLEQILHASRSCLSHTMAIKWLQFLGLDLFRVRVCDHLKITIEIQSNQIKIKVLLEDLVRLEKLVVLRLGVCLQLDHVLEELLAFFRSLLDQQCELLVCLLEVLLDFLLFLEHCLLFKFCLVSVELDLAVALNFLFYD